MKFLFISAFIGLTFLFFKASACSFQLMIPKDIKVMDVRAALKNVTSNFNYNEQTQIVHFKLSREVTQSEVEKALSLSHPSTVIVMPSAGKKSIHH